MAGCVPRSVKWAFSNGHTSLRDWTGSDEAINPAARKEHRRWKSGSGDGHERWLGRPDRVILSGECTGLRGDRKCVKSSPAIQEYIGGRIAAAPCGCGCTEARYMYLPGYPSQ